MNKTQLMRRNDAALSITFTPEAQAMREEALGSCELITAVSSPGQQELAVDAQRACRQLIKLVEESRKEVKQPVLEYGRAIDGAAKEFIEKVKEEELRVAKLLGDFQEAELARARSAQAAQQAELTELERAREERLATVSTLEERERIHEEFSALTQTLQPVQPVRAEGQRVTEEWQFEVTDPFLLARVHPSFVKIEPKRQDIKDALKTGMTVSGIRAWKETVSRVS